MGYTMLCVRDIMSGENSDKLSDLMRLGTSLGLSAKTMSIISDVWVQNGMITRPIEPAELEQFENKPFLRCEQIRKKYCLGDKCRMCPDGPFYTNSKLKEERVALATLLSQSPLRFRTMFPSDADNAHRIMKKFGSYENMYDEAAEPDSFRPGHLNAMIYESMLHAVKSKEVPLGEPLYETLSAESLVQGIVFLNGEEYLRCEAVASRITKRYQHLCELAATQAKELASQKTPKDRLKVLDAVFAPFKPERPGKGDNKNKAEAPVPVPEELQPVLAVQQAPADETAAGEPAGADTDILRYDVRITDSWLTENGFIDAESDDGMRVFQAYIYAGVYSAAEAVYNTDRREWAFLLMFPNVKLSKLYDVTGNNGSVRYYVPVTSPIVPKAVKEHLSRNRSDHKVTSHIIPLASLCFRAGMLLQNATAVVQYSAAGAGEFMSDKPEFLGYLKKWDDAKVQNMPLEDFYFERALGRSMYLDDITSLKSPYIAYSLRNGGYVFGTTPFTMLDKGYLKLTMLLKNEIDAQKWYVIVHSLIAELEKAGVFAKHGARILKCVPAEQRFEVLVHTSQYRFFYTVLAAKALKAFEKGMNERPDFVFDACEMP